MEKSPSPDSRLHMPVRDQALAERLLSEIVDRAELRALSEALRPAELFLVGGTVRDAFLDASGTDIDIATSISAESVRDRCEARGIRVIETGIQHGTVLVVINGLHIEVTTFREPSDRNSHQIARDIATDLSGRDFTINALAFSFESRTIADPFGGLVDLEKGIVRAVLAPSARIAEDPLRILRMIRFGDAQGRTIEDETLKAAASLVPQLQQLSVERIRTELEQILLSSSPDAGIRRLNLIGALPYTLPELIVAVGFEQNKYHIHDVFEHTLWVLKRAPSDRILRWAAIFHDIGKPHTLSIDDQGNRHFYSHEVVSEKLCRKRMKHLRFSHDDIERVNAIVRYHMRPLDCGPAGVRRLMRDLGENLSQWREFKNADSSPLTPQEEFSATARYFDQLLATEQARMSGPSYGRLAVTGDDLIKAGCPQGPALGKILKELEELVIEDPTQNDKATLLAGVHKKLQENKSLTPSKKRPKKRRDL